MDKQLERLLHRAKCAMADDGSNDEEHEVLEELVDYLEAHYGTDTTDERSVSGTCIR